MVWAEANNARRIGQALWYFAEMTEAGKADTGYIVLGMIIEVVTEQRLPTVLRERVLRPAKMRDSYLPTRPGEPHGPHPKGYLLPAEGPVSEVTRLDPSWSWAAYGLVSTPRDIERSYRALWSGRLLDDAGPDLMTRTVPTGHPYFPTYGIGLESVRLTCSEPGLGHTGSILGYSSFAFTSADQQRSVVSCHHRRTGYGHRPVCAAPIVRANASCPQRMCGISGIAGFRTSGPGSARFGPGSDSRRRVPAPDPGTHFDYDSTHSLDCSAERTDRHYRPRTARSLRRTSRKAGLSGYLGR